MKTSTTDGSATHNGAWERPVLLLKSSMLWQAFTVSYCLSEGRKNEVALYYAMALEKIYPWPCLRLINSLYTPDFWLPAH